MNKQDLLDTLLFQVGNSASCRKIMQDGIVSDDESAEQAARTDELVRKTEDALSPEEFSPVSDLLTEIAVLHAQSFSKSGCKLPILSEPRQPRDGQILRVIRTET